MYYATGYGIYRGDKVHAAGVPHKSVPEAICEFVLAFGEVPDIVKDGRGRTVWRGQYRVLPDVMTETERRGAGAREKNAR